MFEIVEVSDAMLAFPANVLDMVPTHDDIPEEFANRRGNKWAELFSTLFYSGVPGLRLHPREGVDAEKAWRHASCVMRSYQPKHEHKEAAWAFLMDQWFEGYDFDGDKGA